MNVIVIIPIIILACTQGFKFITRGLANKKFQLKDLFGDGGMPSTHSAIVVSLATSIFLKEGLTSTTFAIALVVVFIVVHDSMHLRYEVEQHSKLLNCLRGKLNPEELQRYAALNEHIGHKASQVLVGIIVGVAGALLLYPLF